MRPEKVQSKCQMQTNYKSKSLRFSLADLHRLLSPHPQDRKKARWGFLPGLPYLEGKMYTLYRAYSINLYGTFGYLAKDGVPFCLTIEPFIPVIPTGTYICERIISPSRKQKCYQLANVPGHTAIQIHPYNVALQSKGCIGLGMGLGDFSHAEIGAIPKLLGWIKGMLYSKVAFNKLMQDKEPVIVLEIKE